MGGIGVALLFFHVFRDVYPPFHWWQFRLIEICQGRTLVSAGCCTCTVSSWDAADFV
jgi:hypothetical protein